MVIQVALTMLAVMVLALPMLLAQEMASQATFTKVQVEATMWDTNFTTANAKELVLCGSRCLTLYTRDRSCNSFSFDKVAIRCRLAGLVLYAEDLVVRGEEVYVMRVDGEVAVAGGGNPIMNNSTGCFHAGDPPR